MTTPEDNAETLAPSSLGDDYGDLAILRRVSEDREDYIATLLPKDIDPLAVEIGRALQRCSVPESTISPEEREVNEDMANSIWYIEQRLSKRRCDGGALFLLLQKTIMTPVNLEALLRMCDINFRTGMVRCKAYLIVRELSKIDSSWRINMADGSSFSLNFIRAMSKFLDDETNTDMTILHKPSCECQAVLISFWRVLTVTKDEPLEVLSRISSFDWTRILQSSAAVGSGRCSNAGGIYFDMLVFTPLRKISQEAIRVDPDNLDARELIQKLGACHELFRTVLNRIIAGDLWFCPVGSASNIFKDMRQIQQFLFFFINCLTPLPSDQATDELVHRARCCLLARFRTSLKDTTGLAQEDPDETAGVIRAIEVLLQLMENSWWTELKTESEEQRWERIQQWNCSDEKSAMETRRQVRRVNRNVNLDSIGITDEICANCFSLGKELQDGKQLLKCAGCHRVKYCSNQCQQEHWTKAHKHQCDARKNKQRA